MAEKRPIGWWSNGIAFLFVSWLGMEARSDDCQKAWNEEGIMDKTKE